MLTSSSFAQRRYRADPPPRFPAPNGLGLKYRPVAYETISTVNPLEAKVLQSDPRQERVRARNASLGRTKCWLPKHKLH
ncbi:hypothetical protein DMX11_13445 [Pseudomonas sp. LB-090624]|nr:hypothetical protein DMX11_13445 [Pseudomonas sp. LB-090624]